MNILWFTNTILEDARNYLELPLTGSGFWLSALLRALLHCDPNIKFTIVSPHIEDQYSSFVVNEVNYILVPAGKKLVNLTKDYFALRYAHKIVASTKPDLIHVHGTERVWGNLKTTIPVVISIQGIVSEISKKIIQFGVNTILKRSLSQQFLQYKLSSLREKHIVKKHKYFFGRTSWDRAWLESINEKIVYFNEPRILRDIFYSSHWSIKKIQRNSLMLCNARSPLKSAETAIIATSFLIKKYPNLILKIGGIDSSARYGKYLYDVSCKHSLQNNIVYLGYLSATQTANEMLKAHAYCLTSLIENSPNTLAEAQMLGLPCVSHNVGGVPDYTAGNTALLYESNSSQHLAEQIDAIFSNDNLALELSNNACRVARERHDAKKIAENVRSYYREIVKS